MCQYKVFLIALLCNDQVAGIESRLSENNLRIVFLSNAEDFHGDEGTHCDIVHFYVV